ncbi:MAG: LTA synthase family protein [Anaeroplasma sp.]
MNKFLLHKFFIFLYTLLILIALENILFVFIFDNVFSNYFLLELFAYVIILCPILLIGSNKGSLFYSIFMLFIFSIFFMLHATLDHASKDIFSISYFTLYDEAMSVFSIDYIDVRSIIALIIIIILYSIGMKLSFHFIRYEKVNTHALLRYSFVMIIMLTSFSIRSGVYCKIKADNETKVIYQNKNGVEIVEFTSKNLKRSALQNYGLINYFLGELGSIVNVSTKSDKESIYTFLNSGDVVKKGAFYSSLKDMNVITIMIETGCRFAINEYLTPNLWNLSNEGISFENNYTKNKTNVSEFIGIAGSVPEVIGNGYEVPFSLPYILSQNGYNTSYFHCNYSDFYNRGSVIKKLGFDKSYFVLDVAPELQWHNNYNGNYPLDTEFYEKMKYNLVPENSAAPFYSFWTTLVSHGPYNHPYGQNNIQKFKNLGYYDRISEAEALGLWTNICSDDSIIVQEQVKAYQCAMMNFDEALGRLIDRLKETDQYDNTLLVLYGDHDIYYKIGIDEELKYYVHNTNSQYVPTQYDAILIMYNEKLSSLYKKEYNTKSTKYNDFTSPYIIVPTILELLGFTYNENCYVGKSIFRTKTKLDNIFYSHELAIFYSDKICSSSLEKIEYSCEVDEQYVDLYKSNSLILINRIDMFNKMYAINYYGQ